MKSILKRAICGLGLSMLAFTASCSEDFLQTSPSDSIGSSVATQTSADLMNIINGIHRDMYVRTPYGQGYNGQTGIMIGFDSMADDLVHTTTGLNWHIAQARWLTQDVETDGTNYYPWRFYYKIINNANIVINGGAGATGDTALKDKAIGEAYAYRGWAFFQLVQMFSKRYVAGASNNEENGGVILRLSKGEEPMARSTVQETYNQIHKDLDQAITLLTGKTRAHKSHFDEKVAKGIKARVLLTQGNWAQAAAFANQAKTGFPLMSNADYKAGFNKIANNEWMWGSEIIPDQTDYFGNFGAYMSRNYNSSTIRTSPKAIYKPLFDKFPASDVRTQNFDPTGKHTALGLPSTFVLRPYTSQKFLAVSVSDSRMDVPYMRAGEMYLIEAEALARAGDEAGSKAVFTTFMKNRNPSYVTSTNTGAEYIMEIMDSRRIELWGEGFRWFDLKRLNQPLKRDDPGTNHVATVIGNLWSAEASDPRWVLKIPKQELDANPLAKQNP